MVNEPDASICAWAATFSHTTTPATIKTRIPRTMRKRRPPWRGLGAGLAGAAMFARGNVSQRLEIRAGLPVALDHHQVVAVGGGARIHPVDHEARRDRCDRPPAERAERGDHLGLDIDAVNRRLRDDRPEVW